MKDYSKGKIYCIRSYNTDMVYVGSTIQELSMRMAGHRVSYKRYLNGIGVYYSSFEILKYGDAYIELIKFYPCSCKSELLREEGKIIREMNCVNKRIERRTYKEWRKDNLEKRAIYEKEYREKNKEEIADKMKEYYEKNKVEIAVKSKEYREKNKVKINKQKKEKFNCDCGGKYVKCAEKRHFNSQKHQKYLNEKI